MQIIVPLELFKAKLALDAFSSPIVNKQRATLACLSNLFPIVLYTEIETRPETSLFWRAAGSGC